MPVGSRTLPCLHDYAVWCCNLMCHLQYCSMLFSPFLTVLYSYTHIR